ncbi:MAG: Flp pilus assembly protein CpaB [Candidatus Eisenbacteria bacterium]
MRKGGIVLIVLALLLAAGAAYVVQNYLDQTAVREVPAFETRPVVVASRDLNYGTRLDHEHLTTVDYPAASVPDGAYSHADSLVGQVTKVFLITREAIVAAKLSSKGGGLSLRIPDKLRASSVRVDQVSGVSGFILPGDRVDVLVTVAKSGIKNDAATQIVLQNVEVIAAGTETNTEGNRTIDVQQITLLTTPQDAEKLALAQHQGQILLALRNPGDQDTLTTYAVHTSDIIKAPAPAKPVWRPAPKKEEPPPAPPDLGKTVIRGGQAKEEEPVMPDSTKGKKTENELP